MRTRRVAVSAALLVSVGSFSALPLPAAQATSTPSTLYVDNAASGSCSDTTTNSAVTPYCTIQAAADVVDPGQTVEIAAGNYQGAVTISRSGTAAEPIKFVGAAYSNANISGQTVAIGDVGSAFSGYALTVAGASNVEVSGLRIVGTAPGLASVTGSSGIELDHDSLFAGGGTGVDITGDSTSVEVDHDLVTEASTAIQVDPTASATTIAGNVLASVEGGIVVAGASGTSVTANTVDLRTTSDPGVSATGNATSTSIENNIIESVYKTGSGVEVDSTAAAGTKLDYNIVYASGTAAIPYEWAGTSYASAAALDAASGQGAHDLNSAPALSANFTPVEGSRAINSGDAQAPGETATDIYGRPRALDPNDPITGTGGGYYDRGAVQIPDPITAGLTESISWAAGSVTESFTAAQTNSGPWSTDVTYSYDFGDGSTSGALNTGTTTHTYSAPGVYPVKVTATDADHGVATAQTIVTVGKGNAYFPLTPSRVLDTRSGVGTGGVVAKVPAGGTVALKLAGVGDFPTSGAVAAVLNVTVTGSSSNGFVTVYPDGTTIPNASNLNYARGETVPNLVTVKVGANGEVDLHNTSSGSTDLVADLEGYYAPGTGSSYAGIFPDRVGSTQVIAGTPTTASVDVSQMGDWYTPQVTAVALNVTVTQSTANGFLSVYPEGGSVPSASNLNYGHGETVANMVIVPVGPDGIVQLSAGGTKGSTVTAILDVEGYYSSSNEGYGFTPVTPTRLIDTRTGQGLPGKGATCCVQVLASKLSAIPSDAVGLVSNVTVTNPDANGYLVSYNGPGVNVNTSNINFAAGQTVPNMNMMSLAPGSTDNFLNFSVIGSQLVQADIVVDMFGYFD